MILSLMDTRASPTALRGEARRLGPFHWVFLGRDYEQCLRAEKALGGIAERIHAGADLDRAAKRLRRSFMALLAERSRGNDTLEWWGSRVAERNTMESPLFLHCCYVFVTLDLAEKREGNLLVLCESPAVLSTIANRLRDRRGVTVRCRTSLARMKLWARGWAVIAARIPHFLLKCGRHRYAAWRTRRLRPPSIPSPNAKVALIQTWVDDKCFGADGRFHDRYFVDLPAFLRRKGVEVFTIPRLFNVTGDLNERYRWLRKNGGFLLPEDYLHLSDYLAPIAVFLRQVFTSFGVMKLDDVDISALVDEQRLYQDLVPAALDHALFRRIASAGWRPTHYYTTFEYMILEKVAFRAVKRFLAGTRTIGYMSFASVFPNLLCMFVTPEEEGVVPLPDLVVCNGSELARIMTSEGMDPKRIVVGAALRFTHLHQAPERPKSEAPAAEPTALVVLPLLKSQAIELFNKAVAALGDSGIKTLVKAHPMSKLTAKQLWDGRSPAGNVQFVDAPMPELLKRARVVLAMGSSLIAETVAAGVPTILVGSEADLNFDPLDWDLGVDRRIAYRPEQIREQVESIVPDPSAPHDRVARDLIAGFFAPVNDQTLETFLGAPPATGATSQGVGGPS